MAKVVSKKAFLISNGIFHLLCLSGLIWQVVQISQNYFIYDVVSSITIHMPGIEARKSINICFKPTELYDQRIYRRIYDSHNYTYRSIDQPLALSYLTINQRLDIAWTGRKIFAEIDPEKITKFIVDDKICYHIEPYKSEIIRKGGNPLLGLNTYSYATYYTNIARLKYVKNVMIALSSFGRYPWIEFFFMANVDITDMRDMDEIISSSKVYQVEKMKYPYVDKCVDYSETFGTFMDKHSVVNDCVNNETIRMFNRTTVHKIFREGSNYTLRMLDSSIPESMIIMTIKDECDQKYQHDDCSSETHFTKVKVIKSYRVKFDFSVAVSDEPSIATKSQAKIEDIDFVTYIFGAAGTWFGFSFLMINPFNMFLTTNKNNSSNSSISPIDGDVDAGQVNSSQPVKSCTHCHSLRFTSTTRFMKHQTLIDEMRNEICQLKNQMNQF